jgi:hypothetical protein
MVIHCLDNKNPAYRSKLQTYCSKFIGELNWALIDLSNDNFSYHLGHLIEFALTGPAPHEDAFKALTSLIKFELSSTEFYPRRLGKIMLPFFRQCPMMALNACYVQDGNGGYDAVVRMLLLQPGRSGDTAVGVVPKEALIEWCNFSSNDDRWVFAAQTCSLFERSNSDGLDDESVTSISCVAKSVLAQATDKKNILEIFIDRFHPKSWSGSLAVILRQRLQLLDQLNPNEDALLQILITNTKQRFSKIIASEAQREQDSERSNTARFE